MSFRLPSVPLVCAMLLVSGCASSQSVTDTDRGEATTATQSGELFVGRLPGVEVRQRVDGGYDIRVRPGARLNGSGEPLFVVNGSPVGPDVLSALSPHDIAAVRVLKGASAAIYGHRAGNGVVEIQTK